MSAYSEGMIYIKIRAFTLSLALLVIVGVSQTAAEQSVQDVSSASLAWVNQLRANNDAQGLRVSDRLRTAAAAHARDMAQRGFFSHTGSDRSSVADRVRRQGYGFCFVAENIAKGQRDLGQALSGWAKSQGHRKNMLHQSATEIAVVRATGDIWVMVLGRPGC